MIQIHIFILLVKQQLTCKPVGSMKEKKTRDVLLFYVENSGHLAAKYFIVNIYVVLRLLGIFNLNWRIRVLFTRS